MFDWGREKFGIIHDEKNGPIGYPETPMGKMFECFWCLSLVSGAFLTVPALILGKQWAWGAFIWLASSAGSIMIERWMRVERPKAR